MLLIINQVSSSLWKPSNICHVTIVTLKSLEVNNLVLYIDDDGCNLRGLLLSVDDDYVSY